MSRAQEIRERLMNRKLSIKKVESALPNDIADLKDELGAQELTARSTVDVEKLSLDQNAEKDEALFLAGMVVKNLVLLETGERIFGDLDIDAVANYGLSVLKPLSEEIAQVSGVDEKALEKAKNDFLGKKAAGESGSDSASSSQNS